MSLDGEQETLGTDTVSLSSQQMDDLLRDPQQKELLLRKLGLDCTKSGGNPHRDEGSATPVSDSSGGCGPVRELARVIGRMTAALQAITPAPLCYRNLQRLKNRTFRSSLSYESIVTLDQCAEEELQWWIKEVHRWNGKPITTPPPDMIIETDASLLGWGAWMGMSTGGLWTEAERKHHINVLELKGGAFAVKALARDKSNIHIRLRMDNTSAVAYLNHLGGTRSQSLAQCVKSGSGASREELPSQPNIYPARAIREQTGSLGPYTLLQSGNCTRKSAPSYFNC